MKFFQNPFCHILETLIKKIGVRCHAALKIYGATKKSTVYLVKSSNLGLSEELLIFIFPPERLEDFLKKIELP